MNLKKHAIELYEDVIEYVKFVLEGFPEDRLDEKIGQGENPRSILFHMIATPHFWRKRANRPFEFRAKFETIEDALSLLDNQLADFKHILQDPTELVWKKPTSIPWIMIRSANHLMHHASMLVYIRHIWGLSPLNEKNNWPEIVDLPGNINY